jgi:hypothetical protein
LLLHITIRPYRYENFTKFVPLYAGSHELHPGIKANEEVLISQKQITAEDKNIAFTSMIGLEKADSTHLTPNGLQYQGNRIFDDFIKLTKGNSN